MSPPAIKINKNTSCILKSSTYYFELIFSEPNQTFPNTSESLYNTNTILIYNISFRFHIGILSSMIRINIILTYKLRKAYSSLATIQTLMMSIMPE